MLDSTQRHIRSSITPSIETEEVETRKKPASALEAHKRWYDSEKGQVNKAQLAERRRIEYQLNKAERNAEDDLKADKIAACCVVEIERRRAVLDAAIRAREQDKAQRPKPGRKSTRPKGTVLEEAERRWALKRERYRRRKEKDEAQREQGERQVSNA